MCSKLLKLKPFKSPGRGGVPNRILRQYAYEQADLVALIFNQSLLSGEFPTPSKDADLTLVPKVQAATCEDEIRLIALTATLSKVLEDFVRCCMDVGRHSTQNRSKTVWLSKKTVDNVLSH